MSSPSIHAEFPLPDGQTQTLEFPPGTDPHIISREVKRAAAKAWQGVPSPEKQDLIPASSPQEDPTSFRNLAGAAIEPNLALLLGIPTGVANLGIEGASIGANKLGLKKTPDPAFTIPSYQPRSTGGKNAMEVIGAPGRGINWVGEKLKSYVKGRGGSDADAAAVKWALDVLSSVAGGKGIKTAAEKIPGTGIKALTPKPERPEVKQLRKLGVTPTIGQSKGGAVNKIEQGMSSIPIVGERPVIQRQKRVDEFNRGLVNDSLKHVNEKLPDDVPAGHKAIAYAQDALDRKYSELLPKMIGSLDHPAGTGPGGPFRVSTPGEWTIPTGTLREELTHLKQQADARLPTEEARLFKNFIDDRIIDPYSKTPAHGLIDGVSMDKIRRSVSEQINKFGKGRAHELEVAQGYKAVKQALDRMTELMNPKYAGELGGIRRAYAKLIPIEMAAVQATEGGVFTAEGYQRAVTQQAKQQSVRGRRAAGGRAPQQRIAEAGRKVLGKTLPTSGTRERGMISDLLLMGPGAMFGGPKGMAAGAAIPALYNDIGTAAIQPLLQNPGSFGRLGIAGLPASEVTGAQPQGPGPEDISRMLRDAGLDETLGVK